MKNEWISIEIDTPNVEALGGKKIVILVNGTPYLCYVMKNGECTKCTISFEHFLFHQRQGWCGDSRFAKPTHWMPLPECPLVDDYEPHKYSSKEKAEKIWSKE